MFDLNWIEYFYLCRREFDREHTEMDSLFLSEKC